MPVVNVRKMNMPMDDRLVHMRMRVRLGAVLRGAMNVTMMFVVRVRMFVRGRLVHVFVFVVFGDMQPYAQPHQRTGCDELH